MTDQMGTIVGINNKPFNLPDMQQAQEALNNAKEEFIKTVNDKSKWRFFLISVFSYLGYNILFIVNYLSLIIQTNASIL